MKHCIIPKLVALLLFASLAAGTYAKESVPVIGAQVFIEPGQSAEEVDTWFRTLKENNMEACRIRMFENYMRYADGNWDFSLFDRAFAAADKYGIKVFATLFPAEPDGSMGGFKFPHDENHLQKIADYIRNVVTHFSAYDSMYAWVLINEPGTGGWVPNDEMASKIRGEWNKSHRFPTSNRRGFPRLASFDNQEFLVDYNTWFLNWIKEEIRKYDTRSDIHVNSFEIFKHVAEYDFPAWRNFLTSLGASMHPSWHFTYFPRERYTEALSANCSIIRSGAGELPFWVTELQGGNNTFSAFNPFCPTKEEITQWLWTSIASGVDGIIFWTLNPRSVGGEAGEWALLDFNNNPSDRLTATKDVAEAVKRNKALFAQPSVYEPAVNILYNRESLWTEKQFNCPAKEEYEGRAEGGVMKSAIGFYETLLENGINPDLREMREYDWTRDSYDGQVVILANQIALPESQWDNIRRFVDRGGKLIVEGLTGFYDENIMSMFNTGFPLADVFGGNVKEIKCTPGDFEIHLGDSMPVHLWQGLLAPEGGEPIASAEDGSVLAMRHRYGKGEVVWVPSLISMGARRNGAAPFSKWLMSELQPVVDSLPFRFNRYEEGVMAQTLRKGNADITVLVNKNPEPRTVECVTPSRKGSVIFADKGGSLDGKNVTIHPEETIVIRWDR